MGKLIACGVLLWANLSFAQTAPGGPGAMGHWSSPNKDAFLATYSPNTKLWATVAQGILTETYFPTLDRANTRDTQLLFIVNGKLFEERKDFSYVVRRFPGTLAFSVSSHNAQTGIRIEKDIVLDPARPVVLVQYRLQIPDALRTQVFVLHNPSADNTAGGDEASIRRLPDGSVEIVAFQSHREGDEHSALAQRAFQVLRIDHPVKAATVGFEGVNGPWEQLAHRGFFADIFSRASMGNVAAGLELENIQSTMQFAIALGFTLQQDGRVNWRQVDIASSLGRGAYYLMKQNASDWAPYISHLNSLGKKNEAHALVLKGMEDKTFSGAIIAAPSLPWLPASLEMPELNYNDARRRLNDANGGYHRVWPRDLYQVGLGLLAAGDEETPRRILEYYKRVQLPDGTFPQNTWVDGTMSWSEFQLDQTGYPISLVARLVQTAGVNYGDYRPMVMQAAEAIMKKGPWTSQERWEEIGGLSPNSIAVACQGLVDAAWLDGDSPRARQYLATCEAWKREIFTWTFVDHGPLGNGYFERIELGGKKPDPNFGSPLKISNEPVGGNQFLENEIMDGGFLQWILSGLIDPRDSRFTSSIAVYDRAVRGPAPGGYGYYRYNHDGYGVDNMGRIWPLLSGERALAAIERGENPGEHVNVLMSNISSAEMICEQTEISACPLGWAHAEVLILQRSLAEGRSFYRR